MKGPTQTAADKEWKPRPFLALFIKTVIFVGPTILAFVFSWGFSQLFPHWELGIPWYVWWVLVFALALAVLRVSQALFEKFLPISTLFTISLAFPDHAPSRLKTSLRATNSRRRLRELDEARERGEVSAEIRNSEAILGLVTALSTHDRFTRGHSERVQAYTNLIAEELELSEDDRHKLLWAALLHDLGKLDVPPEILNKPSRPDDAEWAVLQTHPAAGMPYVEPLREWLGEWIHAVDEHHLRFDGEGYPTAVGGRDITLAGRIVAIADAYDVMTSARSYKKPLAHETARQELVRGASTQFDPRVVRAFLAVSMGRLKFVAGPLSWFATGFGALRVPVGAGATAAATTAAAALSVAVGAIVGLGAEPQSAPPAEIAFSEAEELTLSAPDRRRPTPGPSTSTVRTTLAPASTKPASQEASASSTGPTTTLPVAPSSIVVPTTTTTNSPVTTTTVASSTNTTLAPSATVRAPIAPTTTTITPAPRSVDEAPTASASSVASVLENSPAGRIAGSIVASDPEGQPLTYSIIGGNHDGGFSINGGGVVMTTQALDHEAAVLRELHISVSDGTTAVDVWLPVVIADVDESPSAVGVSAAPVAENAGAGQVAGSVAASDPEGEVLSFAIVGGNDDGAFAINANGDITTVRAFDYEAETFRTMSVEVTDGLHTVATDVTVSIADQNEPPTASAVVAPAILENSVGAQPAGSVSASDPEGAALSYSITEGNGDGAFVISASGVVTTVRAFDYEVETSRTLTVSVDDGVNVVAVDLSAAIADVDEAPRDASTQSASVDEGGTVTTADLVVAHPDPEGETVTVVPGSISAIHAASLSTDGTTITYEHDNSEVTSDTVLYTVTDPAGNTTTNTVTVTINPLNDPPTITPVAAVSIGENRPPGQPAQSVATSDPDGPGATTLSIIGGNTGNAFTLNGNQIETASTLDAETTPAYDLVIQATDGVDSNSETYRVNVASVNESPMVTAMADQTTAVRAPVTISVPVTDPDVGDGVSNVVVNGLPPGLASSYNQVARTVEITGTVTDESYASTTQTITVEVTDDGVPPLTSPTRSFDLIFSDIIISPHAGSIRITEVRYAESEKYNPAAPFDALIMDEFVEFTNFGPAHDIENFWLSDTKYPTGLDDLDYHGAGPILPDETGRIYQGFTQPTPFANGAIISSPIRRPTATTYELDDGSTRPSATYDFLGTAYGFPPGPNSLWEAFNDSGDDIWFWDDQGRLVAFVAWDDGNGADHIRERPDPSWGIWDPTDEQRLAGAAPGQSISLAGPSTHSSCWELTTSGTATCAGNFTSANRDGGSTNPAGRVSSQGRVN